MNLELPREAPDVLVVGAGNAALCAAISAHENGARVLMLEAAPFEERGGNSHFTGGAFRFAFRGVDDLISVLPSLAQENLENVDFGTYTEDEFFRVSPLRPALSAPHALSGPQVQLKMR
jgi:tricarballylate dehydrogenase